MQETQDQTAFKKQSLPKTNSGGADLLHVTYYTDPLCCWSWAMEPQWRKLLFEFAGKISYRYCMGGLLPGWKNYHDAVNAVSRPIQMGPVWMHAKEVSGMEIRHDIWMRNPPASSYPACIAVKCAGIQSAEAEDLYLRLLREAIMIRGENIAERSVLIETAKELATIFNGFDIVQFEQDLGNDAGLDAFRKDMQEVQYHHINRFPSLVIRSKNAVIASGYRPYETLIDAVKKAGFAFNPSAALDTGAYQQYWRFATKRELAEIEK